MSGPLLDPVQSLRVLVCNIDHFLFADMPDIRQSLYHVRKVQRRIAPASVGHRRQIGAIGLQHDLFKRRILRHFLQLLAILKCKNAADSKKNPISRYSLAISFP